MNKVIIFILFISTFISCKEHREGHRSSGVLSNLFDVTDNELNGVDAILDFYGGECKYGIGASASNIEGKKKYFELEMSKSESIDKRLNKVHLPSSNIAYLFFKNLKQEKKNYDEIHVTLISKENVKQEFIFSIELLERVEKRMSLAHRTVDLLKEKKYEDLKSMMNNDLIPFDKEQLIPRLQKIEPEFGNIKEFLFFGFKVVPYKGKNLLHLSGAIMRDKTNNEFSIDIDFDSDKNELYQFLYKL